MEDDIEFIARIAHEINRAYCESLGDHSQVSWNDAEQWQKDSAINGVKYKLSHPLATPEDMHKSWLQEKVNDGWIYGPIKDVQMKQHPCMVDYNNLPQEQRSKDHIFSAVVNLFK
jgi:hypothetical protein